MFSVAMKFDQKNGGSVLNSLQKWIAPGGRGPEQKKWRAKDDKAGFLS